MSRKYLKYRSRAFVRQKGRCYYCGFPMWLCRPRNFASQHKLTDGQIARFQCTAEHLQARQDGGKDTQANIVSACKFCNSTRHKTLNPLKAGEYRKKVKRRLKKSKWHPEKLHCLLALP
jgi:hypothetical protein